MAQMTDAEWREFVMAGTRTGKLAVTRRDGRPHVTPVWFALDGDDLVLTTHSSGLKARVLRRNPATALCVDEQRPPYSFVLIEGTAELSEDLAGLRHWAAVLGGRYMGAERAEEYGRRNGIPGELLVRLHIGKVIAERDIAS